MDFIKDRVKMKVHFSDWDSFYIKKIEIASGYQTYHYKEDLDEDHYQFFYDKYCAHRNEVNEKKKRVVEKSMEQIRTALGKDVLRDGKIDMLLNSDDVEQYNSKIKEHMVDSIMIMEFAIRNFIDGQELVESLEDRKTEISASLSGIDLVDIWN